MRKNHVVVYRGVMEKPPFNHATTVCHNETQSQTKIKMSRYSFQDVYNHVCRICHPIKHERLYPCRLSGAHWNTLTFRLSRRTEPTQSLR